MMDSEQLQAIVNKAHIVLQGLKEGTGDIDRSTLIDAIEGLTAIVNGGFLRASDKLETENYNLRGKISALQDENRILHKIIVEMAIKIFQVDTWREEDGLS